MESSKIALHVAGMALVAGTWVASARAAEPTYEELRWQIEALQARLDQLEQKQSAASAEVTRTVDQIVKDAERRSSLLLQAGAADDPGAGHDGKAFFIRSDDGNFVLRPGVEFQFRNITTYADEPATDDDAGGSTFENGFEVRRLRPRIDGNLFTPKFTYFLRWDSARNGGGVTLLDAQAQYQFADHWAVKFGQFKESVFHEKDVSFIGQLAVERTLVDALLGGNLTDRVQGVALSYGGKDDTPLRVETAFHDGANSKNTNFEDTAAGNFGLGARAEYKVAGKWADYRDFTARSTKEALFVVGGGAEFTEAGDSDAVLTTLDAQYKTPTGWSLYGALHGNFVEGDDSAFNWGALAQVGYAINKKWEPFVRYDLVSLEDADGGDDVYNELTAGVNYYLGEDGSYGHRAKVSVDFLYLPDGAPNDQTGLGILASDGAEFVLRTQFQLVL
jgi:hypothetical protein